MQNTPIWSRTSVKNTPTVETVENHQKKVDQILPYSDSVTKDLPPVLHVKDLTSLLSVSHNTAYQLVRSGQIRSIRIGRTYRIPRDAVAEYLCA